MHSQTQRLKWRITREFLGPLWNCLPCILLWWLEPNPPRQAGVEVSYADEGTYVPKCMLSNYTELPLNRNWGQATIPAILHHYVCLSAWLRRRFHIQSQDRWFSSLPCPTIAWTSWDKGPPLGVLGYMSFQTSGLWVHWFYLYTFFIKQ